MSGAWECPRCGQIWAWWVRACHCPPDSYLAAETTVPAPAWPVTTPWRPTIDQEGNLIKPRWPTWPHSSRGEGWT